MNKSPGFALAVSVMLMGAAMKTNAADTLNPVVEKSAAINESAVKSQLKIDRLAEQIGDKLQQFKAVNKEVEGLTVYNQQMDRQLQSQLLEMQRINDSIDKVSVIERQITPLMLRMIKGLNEFIQLDVPFLGNERNQRIASLSAMMDRADVAVSEKFRRILEAFQVEVDYGRTIESYTGKADIDGTEQEVNYLRIGRVALVYQTRDRKRMGIWNQQERQWEALSNDFRNQIVKGLRMAQKQLAPDMIVVPVSAAK